MNYFRTCNITNKIIKNHSITKSDLELFYDFLSQPKIAELFLSPASHSNENITKLVKEWFIFLQSQKKQTIIPQNAVYGNTIYRATFGEEYTFEQLAKNPLYYSVGSNGTGLYAVTDTQEGISYVKRHLTKRFSAFNDDVGNILKIDIDENSNVFSKAHLCLACKRFINEIEGVNLNETMKKYFIRFLKTDVSITALLLGADIMFMPNGHIVVLNKNSLILPQDEKIMQNKTLQVNLEKFRMKDKTEQQKVNDFLQPQI